MLPNNIHNMVFLLTILSVMSCVYKFDYNVALGSGLLYLGSYNSVLYRRHSIYWLLVISMLIDGLSIALAYPKIPKFWVYVLPILQISCKIMVVIFGVLKLRKESALEENPRKMRQANSSI